MKDVEKVKEKQQKNGYSFRRISQINDAKSLIHNVLFQRNCCAMITIE